MHTQCWMTMVLKNRLEVWSEGGRMRLMNFIVNRIFMRMMYKWLLAGVSIGTVELGDVRLWFLVLGWVMIRLWSGWHVWFWCVMRLWTRMNNVIMRFAWTMLNFIVRLWSVMDFIVWLRSLIMRLWTVMNFIMRLWSFIMRFWTVMWCP